MPAPFCRHRAIGEATAAIALAALTLSTGGILAASYMGWLRAAEGLVTGGMREAAQREGQWLALVSWRREQGGTRLYLYNYGWNPVEVSLVYSDGVPLAVNQWSLNGLLAPGQALSLWLASSEASEVTVVATTQKAFTFTFGGAG